MPTDHTLTDEEIAALIRVIGWVVNGLPHTYVDDRDVRPSLVTALRKLEWLREQSDGDQHAG